MSAVQKSKNNFIIKFIFLYLAMDWVLLLDPEVVSFLSVLFFCELLLGTASNINFSRSLTSRSIFSTKSTREFRRTDFVRYFEF